MKKPQIFFFFLVISVSQHSAARCISPLSSSAVQMTSRIIGTEEFCVPSYAETSNDSPFSGAIMSFRFLITPEGRLGDIAPAEFKGLTTYLSLQLLPGGITITNSDILHNSILDSRPAGVVGGFNKYVATASDVFVNSNNKEVFFECFRLPRYEQSRDREYAYCESFLSYTPSIRLTFTFPPWAMDRLMDLRSDVLQFIDSIHVRKTTPNQ